MRSLPPSLPASRFFGSGRTDLDGVEIYNPTTTIPLIVTPGGMDECEGFGRFARNIAAAAPDLKAT